MIPNCKYHPAVAMRRVEGPSLQMYGKPKPPTHEYFRCSVAGCPFVVTIEKRQAKKKSNHQRRDRLVLIGQFR